MFFGFYSPHTTAIILPSDPIDRNVWHHLTALPNEVAIQTSSHHGSPLKEMYDLNVEWQMLINGSNPNHACLEIAMWTTDEELQSAIFNSLHGYYIQSQTSLRNALENAVIGTYLQLKNDFIEGEKWVTGTKEIRFGDACDNLQNNQFTLGIENHLLKTIQDSLFKQKNNKSTDEAGIIRRQFDKLSCYAHTRPGYTNGSKWQGIGPVYNKETFNQILLDYFETLALCILLLKIAKSKLKLSENLIIFLNSEKIKKIPILREAITYLIN